MSKINPLAIIEGLLETEEKLKSAEFIAPYLAGGRVRLRVDGLVYTFIPEVSSDYPSEGWGVFTIFNKSRARLTEIAPAVLRQQYLDRLKQLRVILVGKVDDNNWIAYPVNHGDARQKGVDGLIVVKIVTEGQVFEQVLVRKDGANWWFEDIDTKADLRIAEQLRTSLQNTVDPDKLAIKGLTPEHMVVYANVVRNAKEFAAKREENRLRSALAFAGATLTGWRDRGDNWVIDWADDKGNPQAAMTVSKSDFTVISSGICLSGKDRTFDLTSVVKVVSSKYHRGNNVNRNYYDDDYEGDAYDYEN